MGLPISPPPPAPAGLLDRCAAERVTGALRGPHGCFYLLDGAVYCVEGTAAPGLDILLIAAGKVPPQGWQYAVERAGPQQQVAQILVSEGWLTQSELEICHLAALLDAAFFALPLPPESTSFTPGTAHWLGVVRPISAGALQQATARRRALLDRLHPWAAVDSSPVIPVRPRTSAAPTTGRQRRLLDRADGRHTPQELARLLGQSAFATLLDIRRLAAAGLVQLPPAPTALPRRRPGACLDGPDAPASEGHPTPTWQLPVPDLLDTADPDIALLVRLRTALEENL
ncbi:hypothetical protein NCG97_03140 [Streptomyces lydicamycinicus]|uniref:Uncharacterized protein n=1 Tax=Streptomyces lydicamycinicus TaxID=1546107 RepID=A0A0P4RC63_9ACTN|nr:hypothetical protein [Streptomyces lydicamycinicus]URZ99899.1 hypothetical protein NCG97_03140 [Streptomyces lydicamycinicus]GAO10656.1 hypothetical protein TPA0598_07_03800 [Streptomyces lydicamycinicus]